jgi:hypothetical protein
MRSDDARAPLSPGREHIAASARMTIALDAPCSAGGTSCSGSRLVLRRLVADSDGLDHVVTPMNGPAANRATAVIPASPGR